jgi:hypothetical protein
MAQISEQIKVYGWKRKPEMEGTPRPRVNRSMSILTKLATVPLASLTWGKKATDFTLLCKK